MTESVFNLGFDILEVFQPKRFGNNDSIEYIQICKSSIINIL